jgi:hypothetical protein
MPTPIVIPVTLNSAIPPTLIVPQIYMEVVVQAGLGLQQITWQLHGNASTGVFVNGDSAHPPIKWLGSNVPAQGVFQPAPGIGSDGLTYTLADSNPAGGTEKVYPYQLCAKFGNNYYYTAVDSTSGNPATPRIKNN